MVSVISLVVFHSPSLNLIYTVLVPSPLGNVKFIVELHVVQLPGFALLPYATCTVPSPKSVAHIVFRVTFVQVVYVALLFIVNVPFIGAALSTNIL